jgi:TPR repeat protein
MALLTKNHPFTSRPSNRVASSMRKVLLVVLWLLSTQAFAQQADKALFPPPVWNNSKSMLSVGSSYSHGTGVPQDYEMALRCYRRAAELGNVEALYNIGVYYAVGRGVPADRAQALVWFHRAAAQGHAPAMNSIGVINSSKFQGNPDYCEALKWFKKSAEHGCATGMQNAGHYYREGLCPGTRSTKLARQSLQNAIDIGGRASASQDDKRAATLAAQELQQL